MFDSDGDEAPRKWERPVLRPRSDNSSGYRGVSRHESGKWAANIARNGIKYRLGLFNTAEAAAAAYHAANERLTQHIADPKAALLTKTRETFERLGPSALNSDLLNQVGITRRKLRKVGLNYVTLLSEAGLAEEYARWRSVQFTYAGETKRRWDWDDTIEAARRLAQEQHGLPTVQWCRLNGHGELPQSVYRLEKTWEDLRIALGEPATVMRDGKPRYFESRSGIRWRSRPEACLSNFLYARGIEHRRGDRYPAEYAARFGRRYARYDLHFRSCSGKEIDVEIWGDIPDAYSHGRYAKTRQMKEEFNRGRDDFLGIHYLDCQSEDRIHEILEPFIGRIAPFHFDRAYDPRIESAHWSDADECLETCRRLAAQMPDGIFPNEQWLRKRGRFADRPGEAYNTLAGYVQKRLGGTRNVRELLGQAEASTTRWTPESVISAWREFEAKYDLTPAQCAARKAQGCIPDDVGREGARIYAVARRLGVFEQAREGRAGRKRRWTAEAIEREWRAFREETGLIPSQCMSAAQRQRLPQAITDRATNVYGAARRLGMLERLKSRG
jgi:hypothetical protein